MFWPDCCGWMPGTCPVWSTRLLCSSRPVSFLTTVVWPENVLRSAVASAVNFFVLMVLRAKSTTKSARSRVIMSA